jgi:hypothetical protein
MRPPGRRRPGNMEQRMSPLATWDVSGDIELPAGQELRPPLWTVPQGRRWVITCLELAYHGPGPMTVLLVVGHPPNAVPRAYLTVQGGGVPGIRAGEAAGWAIPGPLPVALEFPAAPQAGRATWRVAGRVEPILPDVGRPPVRPSAPTAEYCLLQGYRVRWQGETELQPLLWRVLEFLLSRGAYPCGVAGLEEAAWPGEGVASKTLANTVSRLNAALLAIQFPWTWRVRHAQIYRDG